MERCAYCGVEYHPMMVWENNVRARLSPLELKDYWRHPEMWPAKGERITVCSPEVKDLICDTILLEEPLPSTMDVKDTDSLWQETNCEELAKADGYTPRPDLTPSR